ncbi:MAG: ABC transporter substrate-binding protein [Clostridium sp.]|nr:ABC transporter substrate-binding protein [Clostridium sp.]
MVKSGKGKVKRIAAMAAVFLLLLSSITGCGSAGDGGGSQSGGGGSGGTSSEAMGRYVEEISDLSAKISGDGNRLYRLANGNLVISDIWSNFMKTGDNGAIWMTDSRRWRTKMMEDGVYIMNIAIGADNTVAIIYQADEENADNAKVSDGKESAEDVGTSDGGESAEDVDTGESAEAADSVEEIALNPQLLIIKPDNTEIPVEVALTEDDAYLDEVYIADSGRIFVTTRGTSNIYEVKEDGSSELFLMVEEGHPDLIQFQGNLMVMDGYGYSGLMLYDMEKKEYIEDEILNDFISENYKDRQDSGMDTYDLFFFFGEEDIIYLAGEKGLYRHVLGGSVMEQLIDGKLCSLGSPANALQGMLALENNEFLALFAGGKAIHYTYDPDIPTVPGEILRVYALKDNELVRQAINLYQTQNPNVYIEFECGMGGGDSVTREDALKILNTKIIAGEGADVLILDNMPIDSYIEKGLLMDLTPMISSLDGEEELFGNIVDAMKTGGQLYAVPAEVQLPFMLADKKYLSGVNDLADMADMMEKLRADNPEQDLLGLCSEKSIMRLFAMTCVPAWMTESGELNKSAVEEFLQQTKRIYDAQMNGISEKVIDNYRSTAESYELYNGVASFEDSDYTRMANVNILNYAGGYNRILLGALRCIQMTSIGEKTGFENVEWTPMKGQCENVFWAKTLLGVNAASTQKELAEDFLKTCLGKETQSYLDQRGLPVNKAVFAKLLTMPDDVGGDRKWGSVMADGYDGTVITLNYYWPADEEIAAYTKYMETADTAYYADDVLEDAVYEEGLAYMQGSQSLEEAVNAIEKKVSLYMAE